jgi:hypothetical protein
LGKTTIFDFLVLFYDKNDIFMIHINKIKIKLEREREKST